MVMLCLQTDRLETDQQALFIEDKLIIYKKTPMM